MLRDVIGKSQVWIDGKMVAERTSAEKADMVVPLISGTGQRTVSILIEAPAADEPAGLGGVATVE